MDSHSRTIVLSLKTCLLLPAFVFICVFSLFFILLNSYQTSKFLDRRLEKEALRISNIAYEYRFVLNDSYLRMLGKVIEGEIAVLNQDGRIISASFDKDTGKAFQDVIKHNGIIERYGQQQNDQVAVTARKDKTCCYVVSKRIQLKQDPGASYIIIMTSLDDLETAKRTTLTRTALAALAALVAAISAAVLLAGRTSRHFKNILNVTEKIASGRFDARAGSSGIQEFRILADAVNRMSDRLLAYEKKLVKTTHQRSVSKITAAMAHEIKNPLASIKMLIQILEKRLSDDPEGMKMAAILLKEINRIDTLVTDFRTLSSPVAASFSLTPAELPLNEVISVIKPKLDHLNIHFSSDIESDLPSCQMDKDKVKQVLWNLMINSADSMPGGGQIFISLRHSKERNMVEYQIEDIGSGIEDDDVENLFAPFFTTKKEGIGIGLYVSREIAVAHKGTLVLGSGAKGTRAVLSIPCTQSS
ncbi:sensor histidine kinase [Desulfobacter curvatus]|uniref:sensor histidine kinase n=1 Tax=Desulfobacter curvatus TaxID=2290 RepID=UPI00037000C8|nr:HAMP domain-containing sensor histidine kinase [Desulfobacter curvatus]